MGLIWFIGINVLLVMTIVGFVRKPGPAIREFFKRPILNLFALAWGSRMMVAGWGVLSNGYLSWPVYTPWRRIDSWKLAGLLSFAGLVILFVASAWEGHLHRKKYYGDK